MWLCLCKDEKIKEFDNKINIPIADSNCSRFSKVVAKAVLNSA